MSKYVSLSRGFMVAGIIGFLLSFFIMKYSRDWGFTFAIFFGFIFIASFISMTKADVGDKQAYKELAIHEEDFDEKLEKQEKEFLEKTQQTKIKTKAK
jgi:hypothetical protein